MKSLMLKNQTLFIMIKKIKIVTVVGTRPELIRLSRVISTLEKNTDHILVHTGQNYDFELSDIFFKDLSIKKPKYQLKINNKSTIYSITSIINQVDDILKKENPDAFLILGDTNSCLSAYAAKRKKIPVFHIEAGNRCYDERVPEEINRKIIDHISDINITYSELAKQNLLRENLSPDKIFKIGSPLDEVCHFYKKKIIESKILKKHNLKKNSYYVLSVHREENITSKKNLDNLMNLLTKLNSRGPEKIVFSAHPRTIKSLKNFNIKKLDKILILKPFSYSDYMNLQMNSKLVLSDSGSITEEASILNFSAINLRNTNERQEGMAYGIAPMVHFDYDKIDTLIDYLKDNNFKTPVSDYICPDFSNIFFKILISYIDYIKEKTWKN